MKFIAIFTSLILSSINLAAQEGQSTDSTVTMIEATSFALRGEPKYKEGFTHWDYVNPDAPKGGVLRDFEIGTYDNFNRFAQRGEPAANSEYYFDKLMDGNNDELSVYYPVIAEKIQYAEDYSSVTIFVNPKARFTDGKKITAKDVKFTFHKLWDEGVPFVKQTMAFIESVTVLNEHEVRFDIKEGEESRDNITNVISLRVFPEHFWKDHNLSEPLKIPPVGSSDFIVKDYKLGEYIIYQRLKDFWGKDLPAYKGLSNYDEYRYDYYRDQTVAFEAFKAGEIDMWSENIAKNWATAYTGSNFDKGYIKKESIAHNQPAGMQSFVMNYKNKFFKHRNARKAIHLMTDFEWMNKNLFYSQYTRVNSYFHNTKYAATGLPSKAELALLEPYKDQLPKELFEKPYQNSVTDGSGQLRSQQRQAVQLLKEAGFTVKDGKMYDSNGDHFEFELLLYSQVFEKTAIPIKEALAKIGITMNIRILDAGSFQERVQKFDFDMHGWGYRTLYYPSESLRLSFHSEFVDSTYNKSQYSSEVTDYLINKIVDNQEDESALVDLGRALDRVMLWEYIVIPQWTISSYRISYWNKFSRPGVMPKYSLGDSAWWIDSEKQKELPKAMQ